MSAEPTPISTPAVGRRHPFWRAVFRGLGVVLPPLLTVVIFVWAGNTINRFVLQPVATGARDAVAYYLVSGIPVDLEGERPVVDGRAYVRLAPDSYVTEEVYRDIAQGPIPFRSARTPIDMYQQYVERHYLQPWVVIPVVLMVFILVVYLLGSLLAAGIGRVLWNTFELVIGRLPVVSNVYAAVKQVTDFMFSENEVQYTRVVAIQYPRKGIWTLGLVTGDSLADLHDAADEAVVSVLVPASPMPVTGYTVSCLKSETLELDITIDQALQYIVSCGVVTPPQQMMPPNATFSSWQNADDSADASGRAPVT